jgi:hypothetical protein
MTGRVADILITVTFSYVLVNASYPPLVLCVAALGLLLMIPALVPLWRLLLQRNKWARQTRRDTLANNKRRGTARVNGRKTRDGMHNPGDAPAKHGVFTSAVRARVHDPEPAEQIEPSPEISGLLPLDLGRVRKPRRTCRRHF